MNDIEFYRNNINKLDFELIEILNKRFEFAENIQKIKFDNNIPVDDPKREYQIIQNLIQNFGYEKEQFIKNLFNLIFNEVKREHYSKDKLDEIIKNKPFIISGPCSVESFEQINEIASIIASMGIKLFRAGAFKPRTSPYSFQGAGEEGLIWASEAAKSNDLFLVSEILDTVQLEKYIDLIDVVQIGSRNMASYEFLKNVGKLTAQKNKFVLLKRGFSATLNEFLLAAEYIKQAGNNNIILCLRGIRTFEQIDSKLRNTADLASISELKSLTNLPVCFDSSHSTGNSDFVFDVSKAALVLGADGIMVETHQSPETALIDGYQSVKPNVIKEIIDFVKYKL